MRIFVWVAQDAGHLNVITAELAHASP